MGVRAFQQYAKEMRQKKADARAAEKFGDIWAFADEKKKKHPDMPGDLYGKLRNCQTKAEAKRLWKSYLTAAVEPDVDLGPRWMVPQ